MIIALVRTAKNNIVKKLKYPKFTIDNNDCIILKSFSVIKKLNPLPGLRSFLYPKILKWIQCFSKNYN